MGHIWMLQSPKVRRHDPVLCILTRQDVQLLAVSISQSVHKMQAARRWKQARISWIATRNCHDVQTLAVLAVCIPQDLQRLQDIQTLVGCVYQSLVHVSRIATQNRQEVQTVAILVACIPQHLQRLQAVGRK